jgi:hypothetical protein
MYLRRKDGGAVGYLQLAHNVWDRASRQSRVRVIHSFGREDELDRAAIVRLIGSLERVLEPGQALEARGDEELRFVESRAMGGALMLDGLWRRLGIDTVMAGLLKGRRLDGAAERVLFALVANRALEPLSKLAATAWVSERAGSTACPTSATTPATARWTGSWRSRSHSASGCTGRPQTS